MRVAIEHMDAIFEALVLCVLLVTVDAVHGCTHQCRGHLERDACACTRLIEQIEQPLACKQLLYFSQRCLLELERGRD